MPNKIFLRRMLGLAGKAKFLIRSFQWPSTIALIISDFAIIFWWLINLPLKRFAYLCALHLILYIRSSIAKIKNPPLDQLEVKSKKSSDRVFVFGAGLSLNDIPSDIWEKFEAYDTIGFNSVFFLRKVKLTFFILKEWGTRDSLVDRWHIPLIDLVKNISQNEFLKETTFLLQRGISALLANRLLGNYLWPRNFSYATYWIDRISLTPSKNFWGRFVHRGGTLCSAVSFAVQMGYKEIVLVGVDLTERGYFWSPPGYSVNWSSETGELFFASTDDFGQRCDVQHNTVNNGIVEIMGEWANFLSKEYDVKLFVYNPQSLLTKVLPIFRFDGDH